MQGLSTSEIQQIVNKCNTMVDFTHNVGQSITTAPWVVSIETICETKNPSLIMTTGKKVY